ncbi:putative choline sulfatase [Phaeomoniella chlamydospora]|uniref:Putative choline sulfatase n=1 Tax=Phaeomoniella chlamydospora TaxID=158046 RepID=A0A0G2E455_PHACM|nr:putative choline sulfatase [Phaeomoniella chlamydospora]
MPSSDRPNILYIMADQMCAPLLPFHDPKSVIKMPNLMKLAQESVVFDSAYCNSPLCAPSRFSLVTGQLPHKIGGYDNAAQLSSEIPTYAHYLRREGYHTALAGKMHFIGPDQLHGFEQRLTSDIYPGDFGWTVNWDEPEVMLDWYHNMSSVVDAGPVIRTNQIDYDEEVLYKSQQYLYDHVRRRRNQPFALTASFTHPHDPYNSQHEYWDLYEGVDIPLPKTPAMPQDKLDPHSQRITKIVDLWGKEFTEEQILAARRAYFSACTYVDDQVGKLLKTLKDCGFADNTIIVFSGDHGDMLGEKGLWYKMNWFEGSARVPLLVHYPQKFAPKHVKESVSTMDLLPTFVDFVGGSVEPELPLDGVSLLPYIDESEGQKLDTVVGEYMGEATLAPVIMIRRGKWKWIYSPIDPPQLYDVESDPQENVNLAANYSNSLPSVTGINTAAKDSTNPFSELTAKLAPGIHKGSPPSRFLAPNANPPSPPITPQIPTDSLDLPSVIQSFLTETAQRWDFERITADVIRSQRYRRMVHGALIKGEHTVWDYTVPSDGSKTYVRNMGRGHEALEDFEVTSRWPRVAR